MNKGCYGISPRGKGLSGGLFGFPLGTYGDSLPRTPPITDYDAWWDAAHFESFTLVSDRVSVWADRSSNGHDLLQSNSSFRPFYGAGGSPALNGITIPRWSGGNLMDTSALGVVPPCTFIAVVCPEAIGDNVVMGRVAGNDWRAGFRSNLWGSTCFSDTGETALSGATIQSNAAGASTFGYVVCQGSDNVASGHYLRVGSVYSETTFNMPAGSSPLRMGDRNTGSPTTAQAYSGSIAEALFWTRKLTHDEVSTMFNYLRNKWGV